MKKIVLELENFEDRKISELQDYIRRELDKINVYYQPAQPFSKKRMQYEFDLKFIRENNTNPEPISQIEIK